MVIVVQIEHWRLIDGYDNYEISSHGRVRNSNTMKILKQNIDCNGYYYISLWKNNKGKKHKIHRLVAFTYCINLEDYDIVDHINRIKTDNMFNNLRWTTISGNVRNTKLFNTNTSGTKGVTYDKSRDAWVAFWYDLNGKCHSKRFTIKQHGDNAKQLAINLRKEMEELYYKIVLP